jgi:hypothetical protein
MLMSKRCYERRYLLAQSILSYGHIEMSIHQPGRSMHTPGRTPCNWMNPWRWWFCLCLLIDIVNLMEWIDPDCDHVLVNLILFDKLIVIVIIGRWFWYDWMNWSSLWLRIDDLDSIECIDPDCDYRLMVLILLDEMIVTVITDGHCSFYWINWSWLLNRQNMTMNWWC